MKKSILFFILLPILVLSQSIDQNFVKSITYKQPTTSSLSNPDITIANIEVTYFNGLGKIVQQIAHKQSNTGKDIITHFEYDQYGRQIKEFLPFANQTPSLNYMSASTVNSELATFYSSYNGGTTNPFSEKQLESSPLNRVFKQAAPGNPWALGQGKEIKFDYQTNTETEVKLFKATATWNASFGIYDISITHNGNYQANQLYKTITKDENWTSGNNNTTEEFKDKEGKVVLKRTYNNNEAHDTYYVYDPYGNLTYVIPPLAEGVATQENLNNLSYQYKYDSRNRLVEKKLPGKQWEFIVYDKLDRPVATGPAFSPYGDQSIGWLITQYDVFNRVVQTGWRAMPVNAATRNSNQTTINNGGNPFALSANDVLTKNYYDNYTFPGAPNPLPALVENQVRATNVKGLQTGSWVKVLDNASSTLAETSYTLYDYKYRPVHTKTTNHLGGYTQVDTHLDWAGKTLYTQTKHKRTTADTELVVKDRFEYTPQDRLAVHKHQINNLPEELIAKNTYDELGQLTSKKVGGAYAASASGLQTVDYSYNIRGWLKSINNIDRISNDLFAFKINYNDAETATPLYNGNIAETFWKTSSDNIKRKYNYKYDDLNRLLQADYSKQSSTEFNSYLEHLTYDKNGNIQTLLRNGDMDTDGMQFVNPIDNLTYLYDSNNKNQLLRVFDATANGIGFKDDTDGVDINQDMEQNPDYAYDDNGNMTQDDNKGITNIIYNHLNLPVVIYFADDNKITYLYNAIGQKLSKTVLQAGAVTTTDYLSGFQYKNTVLQFFPHAEGYLNATQNELIGGGTSYTFNYVYNYTDHLGNIRLSYSLDPSINVLKIIEENHYYPFGLKHTGYNSDKMMYVKEASELKIKPMPPLFKTSYKHKFQSQEFQDELGLNAYFFRYRTYYQDLGRFLQIDPVAESYAYNSTYAFAENKVVESIDLEGKESWYVQDGSLATGNKQSGPLSAKYRSKNNLYSPSELQQLKARAESNTGPTFSQDNRTYTQRSVNDAKWRKHYNDIEATKEAMKNHDNIGSPYTQKRVMEGVAHGMVDVATGEIIGKLFQGAKMYFNAAKAEKTIVVIGEGMGRVHGAKSSLLESGVKNVEVFEPSGRAMKEWDALTAGGKHLSDDMVKNTMLYQENLNWIKNATESGKTILDIGNDGRAIESTFYKMEKQAVYGTQ